MDLAPQIRRSGSFTQGNSVPLATPSRKENQPMRTREHLIKVHLTEEEATNIKSYAVACGLTQSALMRMLIRGHRPRPLPPTWFWAMLNDLYMIHGTLQHIEQQKLAALILQLQTAVTLPERIQHGSHKDMGG